MKATIKDVAKVAGVSPSTVSRALQNSPRISLAVREKIRQIADDMGFRPNQMARSLVSRQTRIIGVIFPSSFSESLDHPFYPKALQGLGQIAAQRNHYVLLGTGKEGQTTDEVIDHLADSGYISGLVLLAAQEELPHMHNLPAVIIGRPGTADCYHVNNNNLNAGQEAAQYLIDRGHREIMLLGYDQEYLVTVDRRTGFEQALDKNGIATRPDWIIPTRFLDHHTDQEQLLSIFRQPNRPTAVVCMDDSQAIALCSCLKAIGLSVPQDVSIISFNNTEAGRLHNPPLTSFDVNPYQLGESAMNMILDLISGKDIPKQMEVPFLLMERESVLSIH